MKGTGVGRGETAGASGGSIFRQKKPGGCVFG
jgi:hypothetical protein